MKCLAKSRSGVYLMRPKRKPIVTEPFVSVQLRRMAVVQLRRINELC
jgi:hypothetical protein